MVFDAVTRTIARSSYGKDVNLRRRRCDGEEAKVQRCDGEEAKCKDATAKAAFF